MKQFIGTKRIKAKPMSRLEYNKLRGWVLDDNENGLDAGYLIEYPDGDSPNVLGRSGHISWLPAEIFEKTYQSENSMSFGHAIQIMKSGHKIARIGWNGTGMYVVYQKGYTCLYGISTKCNVPSANGFPIGTEIQFRPHMQLFTAQGDFAMWSPSGSDALADDWFLVE